MIFDSFDIETDLRGLATVVDAILFKHHKLNIDFPVQKLLKALPKNSENNKYYGEYFTGKLGIKMLLLKHGKSVFDTHYYSEDVEFERHIQSVNIYVEMNSLDINNYKAKYALGDFRDGVSNTFITKINYNK